MQKYIIIPEYRPLFALARNYGASHGPLTKPAHVTLDIISGLLDQTGDNALTVYEVQPKDDGSMSAPVRLTKENYMLPYEEIAGITHDTPTIRVEEVKIDPVVVSPVVTVKPDPNPNESSAPDPAVLEERDASLANATTEPAVENADDEPEESVPETDETPAETANTDSESRRLTKAERRAAAKAAAEEAAKKAAD